MADSPYPELKKTHTMAHAARPWRDHKPPPSAPVWAIIQGFGSYWVLAAALHLGVFDGLARTGPAPTDALAAELDVSGFHLTHLLDALVTYGFLDQPGNVYDAHRDRRALPVLGRGGVDGRPRPRGARPPRQLDRARRHDPPRPRRAPHRGRPGGVLRPARDGDVPDPAARRLLPRCDGRLVPASGPARPRRRGRAGAVGDRRAAAVGRVDRGRQRPPRRRRAGRRDHRRPRTDRPGRAARRRRPRGAHRAGDVRRRRARPRVPDRRRQRAAR